MSGAMELTEDTLKTIGSYVKGNLAEWMREVTAASMTDPQLLERMVRVEEAIERQHSEFVSRFEQIDKRFEEQRQTFNARFEQVDKRFEEMRQDFNARFEQVDKRFEQVDKRFEDLSKNQTRQTAIFSTLLGLVMVLIAYGTFLG